MNHGIASHADVIRELDGPVKLAKALGIYCPSPATLHWQRRGIPPRYWHRVAELLASKGHQITVGEIEAMPPRAAEAA